MLQLNPEQRHLEDVWYFMGQLNLRTPHNEMPWQGENGRRTFVTRTTWDEMTWNPLPRSFHMDPEESSEVDPISNKPSWDTVLGVIDIHEFLRKYRQTKKLCNIRMNQEIMASANMTTPENLAYRLIVYDESEVYGGGSKGSRVRDEVVRHWNINRGLGRYLATRSYVALRQFNVNGTGIWVERPELL